MLTVPFDYTVAVVANVSKQLSVTKVRFKVSNTVTYVTAICRGHTARNI